MFFIGFSSKGYSLIIVVILSGLNTNDEWRQFSKPFYPIGVELREKTAITRLICGVDQKNRWEWSKQWSPPINQEK